MLLRVAGVYQLGQGDVRPLVVPALLLEVLEVLLEFLALAGVAREALEPEQQLVGQIAGRFEDGAILAGFD